MEYLQTILTNTVQLVPTEKLTESILTLVGRIADITSDARIFNRQKRRWWGRTVNRPDQMEKQIIKDQVLNSSHASFVELYHLTESAQRLANRRNEHFHAAGHLVTAMAFEQLRALVIDRGHRISETDRGEETTLPFAALKRKQSYTIVIHRNRFARKVEVPGELVHQDEYNQFHHLLIQAMTEPLPTTPNQKSGWIDCATPQATQVLHQRLKTGYTGLENVETVLPRRRQPAAANKPEALTAADLAVVLQSETDLTLDHLQRDYRTNTYGVAIPVTLSFGYNAEGDVTKYATMHAHPYTDGAYAERETMTISNRAFDRVSDSAVTATSKSPPLPGITEAVPLYAADRLVWTTTIDRAKYQSRIQAIRQFFADHQKVSQLIHRDPQMATVFTKDDILHRQPVQEQLDRIANSFTIQNLLTLCTMVAFNLPHSHFLEVVAPKQVDAAPDAEELAPAVTVVTPRMNEGLMTPERGMSDMAVAYDIITCLMAMTQSRRLTREGAGPAMIFDTVLAQRTLKESLSSAGSVFDTTKTKMLTSTSLFSMLVGGKNPLPLNNDYLELRGFTTAAASTYPHQVFGACDRIQTDPQTGSQQQFIELSLRRRISHRHTPQLLSPKRLENVEVVLERLLVAIEQFVQDADPGEETRLRPPKGLRPNLPGS